VFLYEQRYGEAEIWETGGVFCWQAQLEDLTADEMEAASVKTRSLYTCHVTTLLQSYAPRGSQPFQSHYSSRNPPTGEERFITLTLTEKSRTSPNF